MEILNYKKIFFTLSGLLVLASIISLFIYGLNFGIDFTGGSVLEIRDQKSEITKESIRNVMSDLEVGVADIRNSEENSFIIRTSVIEDDLKNQIIENLSGSIVEGEKSSIELVRFNTIGPTLGNELKSKALMALLIVMVAVVFFVAYAFRHVSTPVSSWRYGFVTIIALIHDVLITAGVFSLLGHFAGIEIDALFITALLVILGYSINDTIVVFDRVRDNLANLSEKNRKFKFNEVLNKSFRQTIVRSINTSFTTLLALFAIYFIGTVAIQDFVLALIIGIIVGTYSSIFLAIPMLSVFGKKK